MSAGTVFFAIGVIALVMVAISLIRGVTYNHWHRVDEAQAPQWFWQTVGGAIVVAIFCFVLAAHAK